MFDMPAEKRCKKCGVTKPLDDFYRMSEMRDGYRNDCKTCFAATSKDRYQRDPEAAKQRVEAWRKANPEKYELQKKRWRESGKKKINDRRSYLKRTFGITLEQYEQMLEEQGGVCAICERPPSEKYSLHVDHDHFTGRIRGLVCFPCNEGLGLFQDDPDLLKRAIAYVERYETEHLGEIIRQRVAALKGA
jgi:hypothetical protein